MKRRVLSFAAIVGFVVLVFSLVGVAQPITTGGRGRLRTDCATGVSLTWSGSTWQCTQVVTGASDKFYYSGTAPVLSGCGACTIATHSTDARGTVTCSDGPNACTVTFSSGYTTNAPACVVSATLTSVVYLTSAPTTSAFTFTTQSSGTQTITYHCDGML